MDVPAAHCTMEGAVISAAWTKDLKEAVLAQESCGDLAGALPEGSKASSYSELSSKIFTTSLYSVS